jgi:hypothetical protein
MLHIGASALVPADGEMGYSQPMNAILKTVIDAAERLSPEDQQTLATEMEKRAYELWLDAELAKGEASGGEIPMDEVFDRIAAKYGS